MNPRIIQLPLGQVSTLPQREIKAPKSKDKTRGGTGDQAEPNRNRCKSMLDVGPRTMASPPRTDATHAMITRNRRQCKNEPNVAQGGSGTQNEETQPDPGPSQQASSRNNNIDSEKRNRWTPAECEELLYCYYYAELHSNPSQKEVYRIWRSRNPTTRIAFNSLTLANQRRQLDKKIPIIERDRIRETVRKDSEKTEERRSSSDTSLEATNRKDPITNDLQQEIVAATRENYSHQNKPNHIVNETNVLQRDIQENFLKFKTIPIHLRERLPKINNDRKTRELIERANKALEDIASQEHTLTDLNTLIYSTAYTVTYQIIPIKSNKKKKYINSAPQWEVRIMRKINSLRSDLSLLKESDKITKKKQKYKLTKIYKRHKISEEQDKITVEENLKQKISKYAQRIRRHKKRIRFFKENQMFDTNAKLFYSNLKNPTSEVTQHPEINKIEEFWKNLWEKSSEHKEANWIKREEKRTQKVPFMRMPHINNKQIAKSIANALNWKAPGWDQITNFWLKKLTSLHEALAAAFNDLLKNPERLPKWLTQGRTILIPKKSGTCQAKDYRPITCLSVIYKLLTAILSNEIYEHLIQNNLLPEQQKGCIKGSFGCKELLLLNKMVIDHAKTAHRNLAMAWIDYRKAFDSVPHSWIERTLKIYHIDTDVVHFLVKAMKQWRTRIIIRSNENYIETQEININTGIFQGDALSPLLFCMALIPLSHELQEAPQGYKLPEDQKLEHLLYMDDLKLYARDYRELQQLIQIVKNFSLDVNMDLGLEKCGKTMFNRGKLAQTENINNDVHNIEFKDIAEEGFYKYLGIEECNGIENLMVKSNVKKEYISRIRKVLRTELTGKNKIVAINSFAVPVIEYGMGIVDWTEKELKDLDRKTRKILTMNNQLHPRADVSRLYVSRKDGGRGLRQIEASHKIAIMNLAYYVELNKNKYIPNLIKTLEDEKRQGNTITRRARKIENTLDIPYEPITSKKNHEERKTELKERIRKQLLSNWLNKPLHGQYAKKLQKETIDKQQTFRWLTAGRIKGETEALITAAQDQALRTKNYEKNILKINTDGKCRICKEKEETIDHIITACSILAACQYIERHDQICKLVHFEICKGLKINTTEKWYNHTPNPVTTTGPITIIYNQPIHTDRTIPANKPDIILKDHQNKKCLIIDVAVPADHNVDRKEAEKILKYRDLSIEIKRMWHMEVKIIPVIIGALGATTKSLRKYVHELPGHITQESIQRSAILGTAHIIRKTLDK